MRLCIAAIGQFLGQNAEEAQAEIDRAIAGLRQEIVERSISGTLEHGIRQGFGHDGAHSARAREFGDGTGGRRV